MTDIDALIKRMTDRFLQWKLPENFQPDCGIEFDRNKYVRLNPMNRPFEPVGTNLFSATQAEAMVKAIAGAEIETLIDALTTERATIAALEAEIDRLNGRLHYEQPRAGRQGTHWDGCHTGGPEHYECALRELGAKDRRIAELEAVLDEIAATDPMIGGETL